MHTVAVSRLHRKYSVNTKPISAVDRPLHGDNLATTIALGAHEIVRSNHDHTRMAHLVPLGSTHHHVAYLLPSATDAAPQRRAAQLPNTLVASSNAYANRRAVYSLLFRL